MDGTDNNNEREGSKRVGDANEGIKIPDESGKIGKLLYEQDQMRKRAEDAINQPAKPTKFIPGDEELRKLPEGIDPMPNGTISAAWDLIDGKGNK